MKSPEEVKNWLYARIPRRLDAMLALGCYVTVVGSEVPCPDENVFGRLCGIDPRTARRLWPDIEPLLREEERE